MVGKKRKPSTRTSVLQEQLQEQLQEPQVNRALAFAEFPSLQFSSIGSQA